MKLGNRGRFGASSWGRTGLGVLVLLGCSGEDSTRMAELDREVDELEPARPSGSSSSGSAPAAASPTSSDSENMPSEIAQPTADNPAPEAPAAPIEFWPDGASVNGVSADVDDRFHGVAMDAEDNAYAVGYLGNGVGANRVMLIAKYDAEGQPVLDFGSGGRVEVDFSPYPGTPVSETVTTADPSNEEARDVALQSDGRLVVVGRTEDPNDAAPSTATPIDIVLFRLDASGERDLSFGTAGVTVLNPAGGPNELAWGVDVDASDRIYVFGHGLATNSEGTATPRTDQDRYVWRLNADGTLDTTFASQGAFTFDVPNGASTLGLNDNSRFGSVMADGNIIASGYTNVAGRNQIVLAKLLESGAPDTTFSTDGIVRLAPFPTGMAECYGVGIQSDGSVVTTGYGNVDVERTGGAELLDMVSFRVRPDGTPDATWGLSGAVVYNPGDAQDRGRAVTTLPDDRILFAGAATTIGTNKDAMLLLLGKNGEAVPNFDGEVHKAYDFGGDNEEFFSIDVSPSGNYVAAAGYATGTGLANGNAVLVILPIGE